MTEAEAVNGCTASFKVSKQGKCKQDHCWLKVHVQRHKVWAGKQSFH
jgi:hypothetical protein